MSINKVSNIFVRDVMISKDQCPNVDENFYLKECIEKMEEFNLGMVNILDENGVLRGIMTDGDIRRLLLNVQKPISALLSEDVKKYSNKSPFSIMEDYTLYESIKIMGEKKIWDLPVVDRDKKLLGVLHLHPAIRKVISLIE